MKSSRIDPSAIQMCIVASKNYIINLAWKHYGMWISPINKL